MVKQKSFNFTKKDLDAIIAPTDKHFETYSDTAEKGLKLYEQRLAEKYFLSVNLLVIEMNELLLDLIRI